MVFTRQPTKRGTVVAWCREDAARGSERRGELTGGEWRDGSGQSGQCLATSPGSFLPTWSCPGYTLQQHAKYIRLMQYNLWARCILLVGLYLCYTSIFMFNWSTSYPRSFIQLQIFQGQQRQKISRSPCWCYSKKADNGVVNDSSRSRVLDCSQLLLSSLDRLQLGFSHFSNSASSSTKALD